jgi:hypothetical protein
VPDLKKQTVNDAKAAKPKLTRKENANMKPKKKIVHKADRRLQDLHTLHQRTDVVNRLKLPEGGRLKCEENGKRKANQRPIPNFDIKLADLGDGEAQVTDASLELLDDDDLPEPSDLLKPTKRTPSSDTSYGTSDVDALIRDMPLDEPPARERLPYNSHAIPVKRKAIAAEPPLSPAPALKRRREEPGISNKPKRTKSCEADKIKDKPWSVHDKVRFRMSTKLLIIFQPVIGAGNARTRCAISSRLKWCGGGASG